MIEAERIEDVTVIRATRAAILVRLPDGREQWIPRSLINETSEVFDDGDEGELVVARWFAEKEELL